MEYSGTLQVWNKLVKALEKEAGTLFFSFQTYNCGDLLEDLQQSPSQAKGMYDPGKLQNNWLIFEFFHAIL